jgi:hypothetical protein
MRPSERLLAIALAALGMPCGLALAQGDFPLMLYEPGTDANAFLPIAYRCPAAKDGVVELIKMNAVGGRVRFRVRFEGETPRHVTIERAWRTAPFENWYEFADPAKRPDTEAARSAMQAALNDAQGIRAGICFGAPGIREKYDKILEHNRHYMKPPRMD